MNPETDKPVSSGHEITQWHARPFIIGVVSFFIFMGLVYIIVGALTVSWSHRDWPPSGPVTGPQTTSGWNKAPPQLQVNAPLDLQHLRELENQRLHAIKWTDDRHAFATLPIEQAMTLLAQADADHHLNQLLPAPVPATPEQLQKQKSGEASIPQVSP